MRRPRRRRSYKYVVYFLHSAEDDEAVKQIVGRLRSSRVPVFDQECDDFLLGVSELTNFHNGVKLSRYVVPYFSRSFFRDFAHIYYFSQVAFLRGTKCVRPVNVSRCKVRFPWNILEFDCKLNGYVRDRLRRRKRFKGGIRPGNRNRKGKWKKSHRVCAVSKCSYFYKKQREKIKLTQKFTRVCIRLWRKLQRLLCGCRLWYHGLFTVETCPELTRTYMSCSENKHAEANHGHANPEYNNSKQRTHSGPTILTIDCEMPSPLPASLIQLFFDDWKRAVKPSAVWYPLTRTLRTGSLMQTSPGCKDTCTLSPRVKKDQYWSGQAAARDAQPDFADSRPPNHVNSLSTTGHSGFNVVDSRPSDVNGWPNTEDSRPNAGDCRSNAGNGWPNAVYCWPSPGDSQPNSWKRWPNAVDSRPIAEDGRLKAVYDWPNTGDCRFNAGIGWPNAADSPFSDVYGQPNDLDGQPNDVDGQPNAEASWPNAGQDLILGETDNPNGTKADGFWKKIKRKVLGLYSERYSCNIDVKSCLLSMLNSNDKLSNIDLKRIEARASILEVEYRFHPNNALLRALEEISGDVYRAVAMESRVSVLAPTNSEEHDGSVVSKCRQANGRPKPQLCRPQSFNESYNTQSRGREYPRRRVISTSEIQDKDLFQILLGN